MYQPLFLQTLLTLTDYQLPKRQDFAESTWLTDHLHEGLCLRSASNASARAQSCDDLQRAAARHNSRGREHFAALQLGAYRAACACLQLLIAQTSAAEAPKQQHHNDDRLHHEHQQQEQDDDRIAHNPCNTKAHEEHL
eukprot:CAMPEP_0115217298 /NCGR_PEP_ID=MMETSP0270-20121206/25787_1 /TAXON_ID=71861 /ORGANISM="Scrippsiella trochoidea, Strain CCMP3099" /LENGTH=137 /DNA_ID=CAMNT_0002631173 /DNA_START=267 /DNA_END=681 /DNA_ORIENTATION=+